MRVIWVTSNHPDPTATGGSAHEFDIIRAVAPRHEIHLISSNLMVDPKDSALPSLGVTVERIPHIVRQHPDNKLGVAHAMLRAEPTLLLWLLRDRLERMAEAVQRAETERPADLVHVTHGELAPVLAVAKAPTSLLLFDSHVRHKQRELEIETVGRRRLQIQVERARARKWELRWYTKVDGLAAVSSLDARVTSDLLGRPVDTLPNPIPDEYFAPPDVPRGEATVTFVGSLLYPPNIDAITWLAQEIWPQVLARVPHAKLQVVGRADGDTEVVQQLRAAVERVGGELAADVPDIRPWYGSATVVVAPVRLGSGLRNKVIHAMACGAPVVSTPAALEGVHALDGRDVLVGATAADIADRVVELLTDPERARAIAAGGSKLAEEFRSSVVNERFEAWWRRTATRDTSSTR